MDSSFCLGVGDSNEGGMTGGGFTDNHGMVVMPRKYPMWALGYARV